MKVVLVDDEKLALLQLKKMLETEVGGIEVVAMYQNPRQAEKEVKLLRPDAVFMDISMPEIDGMQLGSKLQEQMPNVELVFVTAHDHYALEAFELNAVDYIVKPVQTERIVKTMARLRKRIAHSPHAVHHLEAEQGSPPLIIHSLNKLSFQVRGSGTQQVIKWRTSKAQELFAYLLHNRGKSIARETITELLWPDFESARAVQQLYTTIYHIRQALKANKLQMITITSEGFEGGYVLDLGQAVVDVDEWEKQRKQLGKLTAANLPSCRILLETYQGDYFSTFGYIWAEYERERIRKQWLQLAMQVAEAYAELKQAQEAEAMYAFIQRQIPEEEGSYFALMQLYAQQNRREEVKQQYRLLQAKLEQEFDVPISERIANWYKYWSKNEVKPSLL